MIELGTQAILTCIKTFFLPTRIGQLDRELDLKFQGCGFDSRAGQSNNY